MTKTADQGKISVPEAAPQENRSLIFCRTCANLLVGTAWDSKLTEALNLLKQGGHTGHDHFSETTDEYYGKFQDPDQAKVWKTTFDKLTAENDGIYLFLSID